MTMYLVKMMTPVEAFVQADNEQHAREIMKDKLKTDCYCNSEFEVEEVS